MVAVPIDGWPLRGDRDAKNKGNPNNIEEKYI
jgi:hypothetical protein